VGGLWGAISAQQLAAVHGVWQQVLLVLCWVLLGLRLERLAQQMRCWHARAQQHAGCSPGGKPVVLRDG
jgi:hypothetical protein